MKKSRFTDSQITTVLKQADWSKSDMGVDQIVAHPPGAQYPATILVQLADPPEQSLVVSFTGTGQALAPVVVTAG